MTDIHTFFGNKQNGIERSVMGVMETERDDDGNSPSHVVFLNQTHSNHVVVLKTLDQDLSEAADAVITRLPNVALAMKTADCAPILLWDEQAGIIAAIHSGWQGTLQNIVAATCEVFVAQGADAQHTKAVIGPCLQKRNFQVGEDVYQCFTAADESTARFFKPSTSEVGKYTFDHTGLIVWQLQQQGITDITADATCTLGRANDYYSYRARSTDPEHEMMRNISMVWMIG